MTGLVALCRLLLLVRGGGSSFSMEVGMVSGFWSDSDSTEIYEIHENVIGTIYYLPDDTTTRTPPKPQREIKVTSSPYFSFRCPFSKCKFKAKRWKVTSDHYRTVHKKLSRCKICGKSYTTQHSLKQHLYKHAKVTKNYVCKSC